MGAEWGGPNGDTHEFAGKFSVKHLLGRSPDRDFGFRYDQSRICGCPHSNPSPFELFFHAATLDDSSVFVPQVVVYEDSKPPWDHVDRSIARN